MNLCAFLAPDDIPKEVLSGGAEHLPEPLATAVADPLAFGDAIAPLRHYSLVEVVIDRNALSVHRLVQAVVRDRLGEGKRKRWAEAAVHLVEEAFPYRLNEMNTWQASTRIMPHALAASGHAEELAVMLELTGTLLNQVGLYLREFAQYTQAKSVLERTVAIGEVAYGPNHPQVAIYVNNLGMVLQNLGDLTGARAHYERALSIAEATYGSNHPTVAIRVNNLGQVLRGLGDLPRAQAHLKRALSIDEAAYGPNHPNVASDVSNLGGVLRQLGDLAGARAHYERALDIDEAAYGLNHPQVARDVNNLGMVLQDLGELAGARSCLNRAFGILQKFLGEDHPNTKLVRKNLEILDAEIARPQ
ncbi:MAG TPA: tetratricopeptide repeat protein [Chloroflexia bacterium]|nr:tetratricopeptide repeat protein [Chloroflexia bacterium]